MMNIGLIRIIFVTSGIYDALVGVIFLFAGNAVFDFAGVTRPNHVGYIQFPALLLILFGIMLLRIAREPVRYREFMWYGIGLKASYCGVVLFHQFTGGIPSMWIPFAIADLIWLALFLWCWKAAGDIDRATT